MDKEIREIDLLVIGSGPAGLSAGIYGARANLNMIILEEMMIGGQIRQTYTVDNYPGFESIDGNELADKMQAQAVKLGATIEEFDSITSLKLTNDEKIIETYSYIYKPKAVIISTGATPVKLPLPEEKDYANKGIHYCAVCDGAFYKDKVMAVIGGGNVALEEALFLSRFGKVYMIRRHDYFKGEKIVLDEVMKNPNIEILWNTDIVSAGGEGKIQYAIIKDVKTYDERKLFIDGIFVAIGMQPKTDLFKDYIKLNEQGYIITTQDTLETSVKGVYAAGDVREKMVRQVVTAVSEGATAALMAEKYINEIGRE